MSLVLDGVLQYSLLVAVSCYIFLSCYIAYYLNICKLFIYSFHSLSRPQPRLQALANQKLGIDLGLLWMIRTTAWVVPCKHRGSVVQYQTDKIHCNASHMMRRYRFVTGGKIMHENHACQCTN